MSENNIFKPKSDNPLKSVHLDWFQNDTPEFIAQGFLTGANLCVQKAVQMHHPDEMFYPAAFMFRHCIELRLKILFERGSYLLEYKHIDAASYGHNLHKLWNVVKPIIVELNQNADPEPLKLLEEVILQIHNVDQFGDGLRYHRGKDGNKNLQAAPRTFCIENFAKQCNEVCELLEGCLCQVDEGLEHKAEMRSAGH